MVPESRGLPEFVVEAWAVESEWVLTGGCRYKSTKARRGQGGAFPHCQHLVGHWPHLPGCVA